MAMVWIPGRLVFFNIAPSSSIVPIRTEMAAERRVYSAIAAVIVGLVVGRGIFAP